jgi:hypothetical protein
MVIIGISEILASISALEFFYSQAPLALRSVTQSLNLATNALGTFAVIPLLLIVNSNPGKPRNRGHSDRLNLCNRGPLGTEQCR